MRGEPRSRAEGIRAHDPAGRSQNARAGFASRGMRRKSILTRAALMGGAFVLALTTAGCWAAVIPSAIEAVGSIGSSIADVAEAGAIESHQGEYASELQKDEVCDDLTSEIPLLAELQTDKSGKTSYRELSLSGADLEPQWVAMPNQGADASGWKLASNFTTMDFEPPIQPLLTAGSATYIAYAPDPAQDATEQDQLNALMVGFGPKFGTFRWNNRVYRYAALQKLPCFPPPAH
jgi:hypothetical protein